MQIIDENGKKRFDTRVEIRDPKTGQISKYQPYRFHVKKGANPEQWYERDGIRYAVNGDPIDKAPAPKATPAKQQQNSEEGLI